MNIIAKIIHWFTKHRHRFEYYVRSHDGKVAEVRECKCGLIEVKQQKFGIGRGKWLLNTDDDPEWFKEWWSKSRKYKSFAESLKIEHGITL